VFRWGPRARAEGEGYKGSRGERWCWCSQQKPQAEGENKGEGAGEVGEAEVAKSGPKGARRQSTSWPRSPWR